jgi:uncharacterized membrane protein
MRKEVTILTAAAALGGLLALSPTSKAHALGYTYTDSAGNQDGFLYSGGKYVTLNAPGATSTFLEGINDLGQVVGTAFYSNGTRQNFIDTHGKFNVISDAISPLLGNAINDKDEVLGSLGFPNYGILDAHGVISPINTSGGNGTVFVEGFNNLDQLAGELCDSVTCHGLTDTNGVFTKIDPPNASFAYGQGINDLGQVVGAYFDSANNGYAYLYTRGHFTTIQDPNASAAMSGTAPYAINDLDQIVGIYTDAQGDLHAFFATPNLGLFALATAGPLADPVPESSTWAMMLVGFAGLGWLARLRRRNLTSV